jgi:hypothetical protein
MLSADSPVVPVFMFAIWFVLAAATLAQLV